MEVLRAIDRKYDAAGEWAQIAADLEDGLYPALEDLEDPNL
jgi:hypothetical protein